VLLQRVLEARVAIEGEVAGAIGPGVLLFAGFTAGDGEAQLAWMARKCAGLRIFPDDEGKMNRSVVDVSGEALVVSQFTLYGNALKGQRPSFIEAAPPDQAERLYARFVALVGEAMGRPAATGRFGADMKVQLVNDGPVTLWLERSSAEP
jgi:D-tyrosyl-tRNA(Tyr) deacylase